MTIGNRIKAVLRKKKVRSWVIASLFALCLIFAGLAVLTYTALIHDGEVAGQKAQDLLTAVEATIGPGTTQSPADTSAPKRVLNDLTEYSVIAKLTIEKLNLALPVISACSEEALKVSVCRFCGPMQPGGEGNLVISGHNYKNGSHFGRLNQLKKGDRVVLMDVWGKDYIYEVYDVLDIFPDDMAALDTYEGKSGLSLVTCTDNANKRLLVRCRLTGQAS